MMGNMVRPVSSIRMSQLLLFIFYEVSSLIKRMPCKISWTWIRHGASPQIVVLAEVWHKTSWLTLWLVRSAIQGCCPFQVKHDAVPSMMEVVQCNQPATRELADHPQEMMQWCHIMIQCWSLLLADWTRSRSALVSESPCCWVNT